MTGRFRRFLAAALMMFAAGSLASADLRAEGTLSVDDAKLDSFVNAFRAVHEVTSTAIERMVAAKSEEDFKTLQAELEPKFKAAIEETDGITLAEYQEIEAAAMEDDTLSQRIFDKMQADGSFH